MNKNLEIPWNFRFLNREQSLLKFMHTVHHYMKFLRAYKLTITSISIELNWFKLLWTAENKQTAKTSLRWLAGLSWFKLEVTGFSWSPRLARLVKLVVPAGLPAWPAKEVAKMTLKPVCWPAKTSQPA